MKRLFRLMKVLLMIRSIVKVQRRSKKRITTESRDELFKETLEFLAQNQIILESDVHADPDNNFNPLDEIEFLLKKFSSFEDEYRLMPDGLRVLLAVFIATVILAQGRKALDSLEAIDKDNKRIAYYESKKNASLDDLIDHWTKRLEAENENKVSHPQARREIEVRRMMARMKRKHPDYINFYLLLYSDIRHDEFFQNGLKEDNLDTVINDIIDFFEIGYATPEMIYKSIAIQLFEWYKGLVPARKLKEIIADLIYYSFGKEYKNFSGFDKKAVYLKNVVGDFGIFDLDDAKNLRYMNRIAKLFIKEMKHSYPFLKQKMYDEQFELMSSNLLQYRFSRLYVKYFGLLPKDFHSYIPY